MFPTQFGPSLSSPSPELPSTDSYPTWLLGADNHNLGNTGGGSWFSPDTWSEKFSNAGKFISTSLLSGANSFYNSAVTVGNWFGAEAQIRDTDSWISSIDQDLGVYYSENRAAADLAGFIAGALVPGLAGVKILNAGQNALRAAQSGAVGANMSRVTGILAPTTENYVRLATAEFAKTNASFSLLNANVAAALRNNVWQNVLEGVAFETAVQATMFQSPILDQQDLGDIVKNIAVGGAVGGVVGGAFGAAKTYYQVKRGLQTEDVGSKPFTSLQGAAEGLTPSGKIIVMAAEREAAPLPFPGSATSVKDTDNFIQTQARYNNAVRTEVQAMTVGKDAEIANLLADTLHVDAKRLLAGEIQASSVPVVQKLAYAEEVTRLGKITKVERDLNAAVKAMNLDAMEGLSTRAVKLIGEDAGKVIDGTPRVVGLADSVVPKDKQSTADAVLAAVGSYGFSAKKLWNPLTLAGEKFHLEAEARYIWWRNYDLGNLPKDFSVHVNDIPALERLFNENAYQGVKFVDDAGRTFEIRSSQEMFDHIKDVKEDVANQILLSKVEKTKGKIDPANEGLNEQIARTVNVKRAYLEGTRALENQMDDLFYRQTIDKQYQQRLLSEGLILKPEQIRTDYLPEYVKISYRTPAAIRDVDGNIIDAITYYKTQEKLFQEAVDNAVSKGAGPLAEQLPNAAELTRVLEQANRIGAGPGIFSFASGAYGSLESMVQQIGSVAQRLKIARKESAKEILNAPLVALSQDQKAAIEFANVNRIVASTSEHYVFVDDLAEYGYGEGPGLLARKLIADAEQAGFEGTEKLLQPGAPEAIPFLSEKTADAARAHVAANGRRVVLERELRAAQGKENYKDPNTFYPIRPNTRDYKYFAFVVDPRVTDVGHKSMIHANSERELNELINQVRLKAPEYRVITKTEAEDFYKAKGEYEFDRSLHDNYVDSDLRRRGIASEFFIKTDPQAIADEALNHHLRQEDVLATEIIRGKYQKQFDWLEDQGKQYSFLEASRYGSTLERVEKYEKNPYMSYVKTALDIKTVSEVPLLANVNRALDEATSKVVGRVRELWNAAKSPPDLDAINSALKEAGYNTAYYDSALNLYANHSAPKGELTKFVRGANAILSRFTLGLDPLNALNNIIGANVLRGTELKSVTRAIQEGRPELVGKLAELTKVTVPGSGAEITAPSKLMARAVQNFFKAEEGKALRESYKQNGWIRDITDQFHSMLDDFTLDGTESVANMQSRLNRAFEKARALGDKGEKLTGNTFAEEFNRFITADVMRQITDVGIEAGVLSAREAKAYINTFVNRVEGNIIASQRPLIFQGPIGQAVGLFQSYQFNLIQNLFRYVGEGRGKDIAMLLGLQGTFYGLNGMPGFAFINQHIVGTASGNPQHKDLYDATYGLAGKQAGELLLYGIPSFGLQANLYTRGDINPRQITILPTTLADVPIVGAYTKFVNSILDTASKIGAGGSVVQSSLYGLEHNGISRPLAGIAQVLRGTLQDGSVYATSSKATILGQNDLLSWGSAVRVAGGKPMDQAIVSDAVYRIRAYEAVDRARRQNLGEAVRLSVMQGGTVSDEQIAEFAARYAASGGKQGQFAAYMMEQYKKADTTQSEQILKQLNNPLTQKLQILMGGEPP